MKRFSIFNFQFLIVALALVLIAPSAKAGVSGSGASTTGSGGGTIYTGTNGISVIGTRIGLGTGGTTSSLTVSGTFDARGATVLGVGGGGNVTSFTSGSNILLSGTSLVGTSPHDTVISLTGSAQVIITGSNTLIQNLTIQRSGTAAGYLSPVLVFSGTLPVPATIKEDPPASGTFVVDVPGVSGTSYSGTATAYDTNIFRNVHIVNTSGTAVGTLMGDSFDCRFVGGTGIETLWGGRLYNCVVTGSTYGIKTAASLAFGTENDISWHVERDQNVRMAIISGGKLELVKSSSNGRTLKCTTEHFGETLLANPAIPVNIHGTDIYGPYGDQEQDTSSWTGSTLEGFGRMTGGSVQGINTLSNIYVGYFSGVYLCNNWGGKNRFINLMRATSIVGCAIVCGYDDGDFRRVNDMQQTTISGCMIEQDTVGVFGGYQHELNGSYEFGENSAVFPIGIANREPLALRFGQTASAVSGTAVTTMTSGTKTIELWFRGPRLSGTTPIGEECLAGAYDQAPNGWYLAANPTTGVVRFVQQSLSNTLSVTNTSAFNNSWHHIAVTTTGTACEMWLDGSSVQTGTSAICTGTSRLTVGGAKYEVGGMSDLGIFYGDITEVRISDNVRYSIPFTPATRFYPDVSTVALYTGVSCGAVTWLDVMGSNDLTFGTRFERTPFWVRLDYTGTHYTP